MAQYTRIDNLSHGLQNLVPLITIVFLVMLVTIFIGAQPGSLNLKYNFYGVLSAISFLSSLSAWLIIQRVKERTEAHQWFSLHLLSLTVWAATEAILRFSATAETAAIWAPVTTLGSVFMPISLYMFAVSYTEPQRARQPFTFAMLVVVSALFLTVDNRTALFSDYNTALMTVSPWGYVVHTGPYYPIISLWLIVLAVISLVLLFRFRRRTIEPVIRRQVTLFIVAILLPTVGGSLTDGVLPSFNAVLLPPMTVMLVTVMGIVISYGITKYQFFSFTPDLVASQIVDTMNEAVIGVGPDLRLRYANAGAERLLGYTSPELAKMPLGKLFTQSLTPAQVKRTIFGPLADRHLYSLDRVGLKTATGAMITAKLSITKVAATSGISAYIIVITDISAIAQAAALVERQVAEQTETIRETKAQLDSSINSLELGFLITDDRPEIIMANRPAHRLFCGQTGHEPSTCNRIRMETITAAAGPKVGRALQQGLKLQRSQRINLLEFGGRSWRVFISPVIDGGHATGTAMVIQDITEEQILDRSKDEFFSIASHELRTPLTAIKGGTSMILEYYADAVKDPNLHEIIDDIHESSERLIAIVNDFLDVSRLEQGRITYNLEPVNLVEIVERIQYEMAATISPKGLYLKLGPGLKTTSDLPLARADRNRLKQILFNLVGNATKFTEAGGITIDGSVHGRMIHLTVSDTGRGIPAEMQPLLFHKFQQAEESILTRDAAGGTGLGLYISRLLASGMGGKLNLVSSVEGKGTVFELELPVAKANRHPSDA